jgi:two-component system cell cycle sensor histidine kinase/response regulator CckA
MDMRMQHSTTQGCTMSHIAVPAEVLSPSLPRFGSDMPPLRGSILVVEDENFVREVTAEILVAAGYRVLKARSAVEALREFRQHPGEIELLLVDIVLPGKSGRTIAKELMQEDPVLKTIFISGYPDDSADKSSDLFRHTIYLPKPFSLGLLMQKIRDVILAN